MDKLFTKPSLPKHEASGLVHAEFIPSNDGMLPTRRYVQTTTIDI